MEIIDLCFCGARSAKKAKDLSFRKKGFRLKEKKNKEKDLKRLKRSELIEVIYQMKKNEQSLSERVSSLESALNDKKIKAEKAGSIAEAALLITDIFNTAQEAADIYLDEVRARYPLPDEDRRKPVPVKTQTQKPKKKTRKIKKITITLGYGANDRKCGTKRCGIFKIFDLFSGFGKKAKNKKPDQLKKG